MMLGVQAVVTSVAASASGARVIEVGFIAVGCLSVSGSLRLLPSRRGRRRLVFLPLRRHPALCLWCSRVAPVRGGA